MMEMSFYLFLIFLVIQLFVTDKQKCLRKEHNNMESQHDKQANLKLRQQIFYEKEKIYKFKLKKYIKYYRNNY